MKDPDVFRIVCPNLGCQCVLAVTVLSRGRIVECGNCGSNIRVPADRQPSAGPSRSHAEWSPDRSAA